MFILMFLDFLGSVVLESIVNFESNMATAPLDGSPCFHLCDSMLRPVFAFFLTSFSRVNLLNVEVNFFVRVVVFPSGSSSLTGSISAGITLSILYAVYCLHRSHTAILGSLLAVLASVMSQTPLSIVALLPGSVLPAHYCSWMENVLCGEQQTQRGCPCTWP